MADTRWHTTFKHPCLLCRFSNSISQIIPEDSVRFSRPRSRILQDLWRFGRCSSASISTKTRTIVEDRHGRGSQSRICDPREAIDLIQYWIHEPIGSYGKASQQILDPIGSYGSIWKWILDPIRYLMELMKSDLHYPRKSWIQLDYSHIGIRIYLYYFLAAYSLKTHMQVNVIEKYLLLIYLKKQ